MSWIQAASTQSLRQSLHAVGVPVLDTSSLCTESSEKTMSSVSACLVFKQSFLIESSLANTTCSGSACLGFKRSLTPQSSAKTTCSVSACLEFKQSLHSIFPEASLQWECINWIQVVSPHRVFSEDYMQSKCNFN